MMKCKYAIYWFLLFISITPLLLKSQDTSNAKKPVFTANIAYQSLVHFLGRTDSLNSSAAMAIAGYQLKNGLYTQGAVVFVRNKAMPMQLTGGSIEIGYHFPETTHFSGNVFLSKFIYKNSSTLVQSSLNFQTGINTSLKNKILNVNSGVDFKFSDHIDIGITLGADHLFIMHLKEGKPNAIALNPTVTAYGGTQRFSKTYQQNQARNIFGIPVGGNQSTTSKENGSRFAVLSYEFTMPVVVVLGKLNSFLIPSYVIPQNLLSSAGEYGRNRFYFTTGIGIRL